MVHVSPVSILRDVFMDSTFTRWCDTFNIVALWARVQPKCAKMGLCQLSNFSTFIFLEFTKDNTLVYTYMNFPLLNQLEIWKFGNMEISKLKFA